MVSFQQTAIIIGLASSEVLCVGLSFDQLQTREITKTSYQIITRFRLQGRHWDIRNTGGGNEEAAGNFADTLPIPRTVLDHVPLAFNLTACLLGAGTLSLPQYIKGRDFQAQLPFSHQGYSGTLRVTWWRVCWANYSLGVIQAFFSITI